MNQPPILSILGFKCYGFGIMGNHYHLIFKRNEVPIEKKRMELLIYDDPLYPKWTKVWAEAPSVLYYMVTIRNNSIGIGIVGARCCSLYARQVVVEAGEKSGALSTAQLASELNREILVPPHEIFGGTLQTVAVSF